MSKAKAVEVKETETTVIVKGEDLVFDNKIVNLWLQDQDLLEKLRSDRDNLKDEIKELSSLINIVSNRQLSRKHQASLKSLQYLNKYLKG